MAEVVLNLPLGRSGVRSQYHDLFNQVSDGQVWKIQAHEFSGAMDTFRTSLQGWARNRNLLAETRIEAACLFVRMSPRGFNDLHPTD